MSAIIAILRAIAGNPGATSEEISEAVAIDPIKVRKALHVIASPSQGPLVSRELDDVTKKPGYRLTDHGRKKLSKEPQGGKPKAQPEVAKNTGSEASAPSAEGPAVAEKTPVPPEEATSLSDGGTGGDDVAERMEMYGKVIGEIHSICRDAGIEPGLVHERVRKLAERFSEAEFMRLRHKSRAAEIEQECAVIKTELATERQAREALQEQLDADPSVDIKDAARGYVVIAPKRKLRRVMKPESARTAAMAAARNGSGRGEVYALVHVGTATRGAEWRGA